MKPNRLEDSLIVGRKLKQKAASSSDLCKLFQAFVVIFVVCLLLILGGNCLRKQVAKTRDSSKNIVLIEELLPSEENQEEKEAFLRFIKEFKRENLKDDPTELLRRFEIFTQNLKEIQKLQEANPNTLFEINEFSDYSDEELKSRLISYSDFVQEIDQIKNLPYSNPVETSFKEDLSRPAFFDWRTKNKVTRVKDQGQCGSCFAFAVTGVVESQLAINKNQLLELSEQQILDCDLATNACQGGYRPYAFKFVKEHGLTLEKLYYYVAKKQECRNITSPLYKIDGYRYLGTDEDSLANWLVNHGPFSIGVNVTKGMYQYSSGVFSPSQEDCAFNSLGSHAMTVVGYGEMNGETYWLLKNSWGSSYGDSGYLKMKRGADSCGIAKTAFTASVN
ncbi:hypothetical protein FO519_004281 [Halicephalobus sp. NKZ332]|nr:hypothetical protein FO519_004281 [Halicephalobus sp. NKZ332]